MRLIKNECPGGGGSTTLSPRERDQGWTKMPRSEAVLRRRLCLPMHGQVDPADCREIVETLMECIGTRETT